MTMYGSDVDKTIAGLEFARLRLSKNVKHFSYDKQLAIQSFNRLTGEIYDMASKLKKQIASKPANRKEFEWKGFINVNLSAEDKASFVAWDIQDGDVWDGIAQYAAAGYKIAISYNKQNDKFSVTGTGQPETGTNSGYAVSAFANSPYEAARVWLFKVTSVLPDDWTTYVTAAKDDIG